MLKLFFQNIIFLNCVLFFECIHSQNLIQNPSFEAHVNCPQQISNLNKDITHWFTPTKGTSDYFHACGVIMGIPSNFNGRQYADFGKAYAGLYLYAAKDYREYLQTELLMELERDRKYRISFKPSRKI